MEEGLVGERIAEENVSFVDVVNYGGREIGVLKIMIGLIRTLGPNF